MAIWFKTPTVAELNKFAQQTLLSHLDIQFTEVGENYLKASMPVDDRTRQPAGILHGGASVALAESLGSVAATLCVDAEKKHCVGVEINANHVRSVKSGRVSGITKPIHIGGMTHVWEIKIYNDQDKLVCVSRITLAVVARRK